MADTFGQRLQGLLGTPQAMDFATGLLSQSGTVVGGPAPSFGQAVAVGSQAVRRGESERLQLQAARDAALKNKRRGEATQELSGILGNPASSLPVGIRGPNAVQNEQRQLMGLLAELNPQAFTEQAITGLLGGQSPATSRAFADFQAFGGGTSEDFARFQNPVDDAELSSRRLNDAAIRQSMAAAATTQRIAGEDRATQKRSIVSGRKSSIRNIGAMLDKLQESEGTLVQPGVFSGGAGTLASGIAAGQRLFGADSSEFERLSTLQNDIEKGLNRIIVADIPAAFAASGPKLQFFQSQAAGADQQLGTNFLILRDYLVDLIADDSDDDGIVNSSGGAQELINRIDEFFGRGSADGPSTITGRSLGLD